MSATMSPLQRRGFRHRHRRPTSSSKVFDPFFTTKPVGKGTGLGLSQVHGFAHQAGGTVRIESELGKGTTVTILLPREASAPAAPTAMKPRPTSGSGTVLLVEDNPDVASVSASLLEQLGYTVRRVSDAETALCEIERDGIDLVFSDIVMPGKMDGARTSRIASRKSGPVCRSCWRRATAKPRSSVRGDFPILRKPYEIHQLSQAIGKLLSPDAVAGNKKSLAENASS